MILLGLPNLVRSLGTGEHLVIVPGTSAVGGKVSGFSASEAVVLFLALGVLFWGKASNGYIFC
jgi:hypothetical protein